MSFAGLVERFLLFPPLCVSSKSALYSLCYGFRKIRQQFFWTFLRRNFQEDSIFGFYGYRLVKVPSFSEIGWGASGLKQACGRESVSQPSLPCKMYDEIGLGLLMLA